MFIESSSEEAVFDAQVEEYKQEIGRMADEGEGKTSGAVFLAVAGGRLSQGLNLSDEACRCVMVVGIPYGNVNDSRVILKRYVCDQLES